MKAMDGKWWTWLRLFELLELPDALEHLALGRLLHLAAKYVLVQHRVDLSIYSPHKQLLASHAIALIRSSPYTHLVKVEDDVELAHVGELLVEQLDEQVDRLEAEQLVGRHVHS